MKVLAIDSSGLVASIALIEDDNMIAEYTINYKKTHSQTLLPMMDEMRRMIDLELDTIDVIAVAAGPGSFTGLRIGSATAKGLGLALNKPIVGIPTVDGMAFNLYGTDKLICPIIDARRGQVYTGIYEFSPKSKQTLEQNTDQDQNNTRVYEQHNQPMEKQQEQHVLGLVEQSIEKLVTQTKGYELSIIQSQCAVMLEDIALQLNELNREVIFLGDGVPIFAEKLALIMKIPYSFAPQGMNRQRASSIGSLGLLAYQNGQQEDAADFKPIYLRLSQAERELLEKEKLIAANI